MISRNSIIYMLMGAWLMCSVPAIAQRPEKASNDKERCQAKTQKGERCKLKVIDGSKYCSVHYAKSSKASRCKATTKKGTKCSRAAGKSGCCTQHEQMKKTGKLK